MGEPVNLAGARVLLTGASSGIGRATAEELVAAGANVTTTVRRQDDADALEGLGCQAKIFDVRDYSKHESILRDIGDLDVLINNAGTSYRSAVEHGCEAEIRRLFDVNLFAPFALIRAVLPILRRRRSGAIVNISSVSGRVAAPLNGYYSATKFALEALTEALVYELSPFNIRVALVEPGRVATDLHSRLRAERRTYDDTTNPYFPLAQLLPPRGLSGINPRDVAKVVIRAISEPFNNQLRWPATPDAEEVLRSRARMNDEDFAAYFIERLMLRSWAGNRQ